MTSWHPPRRVLEFAELITSGALDRFPEPVEAPDAVLAALAENGEVVLEDAEGTPVATLTGSGDVRPGRPFAHGPLRGRRVPPSAVRGSEGVLAAVVAGAVSQAQVDAVGVAAQGRGVLWLALVGDGRQVDLPPAGLLRAVTAAADGAPVVPVAVPALTDAAADVAMVEAVAIAYGASDVLWLTGDPDAAATSVWHPASQQELGRVAAASPSARGLTLFFTGLSGSGKSTVAKALAEELDEHSTRTVSLLDGDEVRRLLSAGLSFSRADRDLNIRRIGYVAAEVTRHGGLAICAPIAPFAQVRADVRAAVEEVGDFVLVHVSTPLAECERRDRKGLYAKARTGEIPDFTGISSPYEAPTDAEITLDTSVVALPDAVSLLLSFLTDRGYLG